MKKNILWMLIAIVSCGLVLTGDEHYLDLRVFSEDIKLAVWERQNHVCPLCGKVLNLEFMEGDL